DDCKAVGVPARPEGRVARRHLQCHEHAALRSPERNVSRRNLWTNYQHDGRQRALVALRVQADVLSDATPGIVSTMIRKRSSVAPGLRDGVECLRAGDVDAGRPSFATTATRRSGARS